MNLKKLSYQKVKNKYLKFIKSQEILSEPFRNKISQLQEEVDKVVIDFIEPKLLEEIRQIEHQNQGDE